ncbi:hypothetical protein [Cribrihabitans pelagius]|uniref:hypothetical protein n=1 Tax=Cribrihabitans pelagius TaxID=1765746 RepID=UPI003B59207B
MQQALKHKGWLNARATGGTANDDAYQFLRRDFVADPALCDQLGPFVRTCLNLSGFWTCFQREAERYAERREIVG